MNVQSWVTVMIKAPQKTRTKIKNKVLDGISYFNATYSPMKNNPLVESQSGTVKIKDGEAPPPEYKLKSKDAAAVQMMKDLKSGKGLKFVGFVPEVSYIKETGPKTHLKALWEHKFGSPALLYAHKDLPFLIIAGPNLMFDDSMVKSIKANSQKESVLGITG